MRGIETAHVGSGMEGFAAFEDFIASHRETTDAEIVVAESSGGKDKSSGVGLLIFGERQLNVQVFELCPDFLIFLSFDLIVQILALAPGPELVVLANPAASPMGVIRRVHGQVHAVDENDGAWNDSGHIQWDGQDCFRHEARQAGWILRDLWNGRDRELCRRVSEGEEWVGLLDAPAEGMRERSVAMPAHAAMVAREVQVLRRANCQTGTRMRGPKRRRDSRVSMIREESPVM